MKVLIIGGSGLLGSQAAWELTSRGHEVRGLSLPPLPQGARFPEGMEHRFASYLDMTDAELSDCLSGCEGLVFAAGVDERVKVKPPVEAFYEKYNNAPLGRILRLARATGVRHAVVLGSYFTHFNRKWPALRLQEYHPYIKSRAQQQAIALSFAGPGFDVAVLGLPYIFGTQPGRRPVWAFLAGMISGMPLVTLFPRGGTAMVTVRQVGQAIAGALEKNRGGQAIPVGWYNLRFKQMLRIFQEGMGLPRKPVIGIPACLFRLGARGIMRQDRREGVQGGLHLPRFARVMALEAYIGKEEGSLALGVTEDDIKAAILDSARLSMTALKGDTPMVAMPKE